MFNYFTELTRTIDTNTASVIAGLNNPDVVGSIDLAILWHEFHERSVQPDDFELLVGSEAGNWNTFLNKLGLEGDYSLNLAIVLTLLRSPTELSLLFRFFVLQQIALFLGVGIG